tara:strand:+ start:382 stop:582 length:201 start_codon:yes stop_codon:yes gene_type:complete
MKNTLKYLLNKLGWELSRVSRNTKLRQFLYESKTNKSKNPDSELFFLTDQKEKIFLDILLLPLINQ